MAIGDTIQAGLMRTDSSPIQIAGAAQARANEAFGNALTSVATGFLEGREKKARAEEMTGYLMNQGASESDAKAIARNPFLQKEFQRKQEADQRMKIAQLQASTTSSNVSKTLAAGANEEETRIAERQEGLDKLAKQEQELIDFSKFIVSGTEMDPKVLDDFNQVQPGLPALGGNQTRRNQFLEYTRDKAPKVGKLGGELNSSEFGRMAMDAGLDPKLVSSFYQKLQKAEAEASKGTGKTMTINDPATGQNVIVKVNPDGTVGPQVAKAPIQPPRIADPKDVRQANINKTEDNQAMATEADWKSRALTGRNTIQTVKTMLSTLDKVDDTGGFEPFKNTLRKYAMSAGVDFTDDEKEKLASAEKFNQLSGEFVFKAISQTKGSISEKEMDLFIAMSPSMVNTKLGNRLMLEYAQKRADRDVQLNKYIQGLKKQGMLPQERVEMAMEWLNDPANDITQDLYEHTGVAKSVTNSPPQAQPNRKGVRGSNPPPNSNAQTVNGFKILKR